VIRLERRLPTFDFGFKEFVAEALNMNVPPHVVQNNKRRQSAIDGRTTRHGGHAIGQQKRKRVEEIFGWLKTVGGMRKLRHRGVELVGWMFTFFARRTATLLPDPYSQYGGRP